MFNVSLALLQRYCRYESLNEIGSLAITFAILQYLSSND